MTGGKREVWLQVTAGQGPLECAWAVVKVLNQIRREAQSAALEFIFSHPKAMTALARGAPCQTISWMTTPSRGSTSPRQGAA